MSGRRKFFELVDFPKFSVPSVLSIDPPMTALNLVDRLGGKSFMSYGQIWPRIDDVVRGYATEDYILREFRSYEASWKNDSIRTAVRLLAQHLGGKGVWYPEKGRPRHVLGFWFKPSIRGIWFHKERAHAVLINARKGQPLTTEDVRFLTRGIYEIYCRDDPNDPVPLIIDLSEHEKGQDRELNVHCLDIESAASVEEFERSVRQFVASLNMAGVAQPLPDGLGSVIDLFKKPT